jgi:hypothetical protein
VLSIVRGYLSPFDHLRLAETSLDFKRFGGPEIFMYPDPTDDGLKYVRAAIEDRTRSASRIAVFFALVSRHPVYRDLVLENPPILHTISRQGLLKALFRTARTGNIPGVERLLTSVDRHVVADFPPFHMMDTLLLSAGLSRQPATVEFLAAHPSPKLRFDLYPVVETARELAAGKEESVPLSGIKNAAGRLLFDSACACEAWDVAELLLRRLPKAYLGLHPDASAIYRAFRLGFLAGALSCAYLLVSQITTPYAELDIDHQQNLASVLSKSIQREDLLEHTLQFLERFPMDLYSPMCAALAYGRPEIFQRLIDMGGDRILAHQNRGRFLIKQASLSGHLEILRLLIRVRGHRPEDYAIAIRSLPTVEMRVQIQEDRRRQSFISRLCRAIRRVFG